MTPDITITLPDGSVRTYPAGITIDGVAASIGAGLAKATLAGKVNCRLVDACDAIEQRMPSASNSARPDNKREILASNLAIFLAGRPFGVKHP